MFFLLLVVKTRPKRKLAEQSMQQPSKQKQGNKEPKKTQNKQLEGEHSVETQSVEKSPMKNQVLDFQLVHDQEIHAPPAAEIGRQNVVNTQVKDSPSSQCETLK